MDKSRLGYYVNIKTGKLDANANAENGKYPFFTCSVNNLWIDNFAYDCECILVAGNGDLNIKYYNGKFNAYQRTYIIESNDTSILNVKYLYHFMNKYINVLRNNSIGGVIKYIKLRDLTEILIPIPTLDVQKKVVEILDKSQHIIDARKSQIKLMDDLIKSQFIEMFGDPKHNLMKWETGKIRDVVKEVKYGTSKPAVEGGIYKYIRMNNITYNGELDLSDIKYIDIPEKEIENLNMHNILKNSCLEVAK